MYQLHVTGPAFLKSIPTTQQDSYSASSLMPSMANSNVETNSFDH